MRTWNQPGCTQPNNLAWFRGFWGCQASPELGRWCQSWSISAACTALVSCQAHPGPACSLQDLQKSGGAMVTSDTISWAGAAPHPRGDVVQNRGYCYKTPLCPQTMGDNHPSVPHLFTAPLHVHRCFVRCLTVLAHPGSELCCPYQQQSPLCSPICICFMPLILTAQVNSS